MNFAVQQMRLIAVLGVVIIHSGFIFYDPLLVKANLRPGGDHSLARYLIDFSRLAVPLFFLLSGNFASRSQNRWKQISGLLRIYVLYNAFYYSGLLFAGFQETGACISCDWVQAFGLFGPPAAFHLWFIRDLVICHLIHGVLARRGGSAIPLLVVICCLLWLIDSPPLLFVSLQAPVFFFLGSLIGGSMRRDIFWPHTYFLFAGFAALVFTGVSYWSPVIFKLTLMICALALLERVLAGRPLWKMSRLDTRRLGSVSFGVYLFHEPFLSLLRHYESRSGLLSSSTATHLFLANSVAVFVVVGLAAYFWVGAKRRVRRLVGNLFDLR